MKQTIPEQTKYFCNACGRETKESELGCEGRLTFILKESQVESTFDVHFCPACAHHLTKWMNKGEVL
jgi:hypothetical protein